jgi:UDP-N-acetylglucosamine 2-epimerase (non-hydrolysing)
VKVLTIFGTRPEAIKLAPVIQEMRRRSAADNLWPVICVTAQHRQMLDQVLSLFEIVPDYDLNVMQDNQSPTQVAATIMANLEPVLEAEHPDWILIQGDTTTVAAAALASFYAQIKIGHVEAGLRTFDKYHPFPEEINRRLASVVADLHFAPTERARENLLREGISDSTIRVTGNPVIDALFTVADLPYRPECGPLKAVPWDKRLILVTAHRRENFGEPLEQIFRAVKDIALAYEDDVHIVCPVHLNPHVQHTARDILSDVPGVTLTEPLDYLSLVYLMKRTTLILTDSGGIQEEAPSFGKPVLMLRDITERPEAVESGTVRLVGTDRSQITEWSRLLLDEPGEYRRMAQIINPYGDGRAAKRIVAALVEGSISSGV